MPGETLEEIQQEYETKMRELKEERERQLLEQRQREDLRQKIAQDTAESNKRFKRIALEVNEKMKEFSEFAAKAEEAKKESAEVIKLDQALASTLVSNLDRIQAFNHSAKKARLKKLKVVKEQPLPAERKKKTIEILRKILKKDFGKIKDTDLLVQNIIRLSELSEDFYTKYDKYKIKFENYQKMANEFAAKNDALQESLRELRNTRRGMLDKKQIEEINGEMKKIKSQICENLKYLEKYCNKSHNNKEKCEAIVKVANKTKEETEMLTKRLQAHGEELSKDFNPEVKEELESIAKQKATIDRCATQARSRSEELAGLYAGVESEFTELEAVWERIKKENPQIYSKLRSEL